MNVIKNILLGLLLIINGTLFAQNLKPYILASISDEPMEVVSEKIQSNLLENEFEIVGKYSPANDESRMVFIITNSNLLGAVKEAGGLMGFAATLRVALTKEDGGLIISFTNPQYWGNAYWGDKFEKVATVYNEILTGLENSLSNIGNIQNTEFGSEKGLSVKDLHKYHYMFGMERFDDVVELNTFNSYEEAINVIDTNLKDSEDLVYSVELKDSKIKLYGIAVSGEKGEGRFLPIIDITSPKHTAFLPYELLVVDNKAVMLHGRYRIALSFPDLTMGTFSKIMSTPGDIKKALKAYTE